MGRIKTVFIKRITNQLVKEHAQEFTTNFDENKVIVSRMIKTQSKKLRNIIAGYVTRQMQNREVI